MVNFFTLFSRSLKHIWRNPVVSLVTVITVAIVFMILGIFGLIGTNLDRLADRLQDGLKLVVYLKQDATQQDQKALQETLERSELVEHVEHISQDQALAIFGARLGENKVLLEGLSDSLLPASYEAFLTERGRKPQILQAFSASLSQHSGVLQVRSGQVWLRRFFQFVNLARLSGLVIGCLIIFATWMIISNTIRLSVLARADEILILKLVGATDRFVKVPFYIEGSLLGTIGACCGIVICRLLFGLIPESVKIPIGLEGSGLQLSFLPSLVLILMIVSGAVLGLLGTLSSLWRHLRI